MKKVIIWDLHTCKNTTAKAAEVANFPIVDSKTIIQCIQSESLGITMVAKQANPEIS